MTQYLYGSASDRIAEVTGIPTPGRYPDGDPATVVPSLTETIRSLHPYIMMGAPTTSDDRFRTALMVAYARSPIGRRGYIRSHGPQRGDSGSRDGNPHGSVCDRSRPRNGPLPRESDG
jgi:hypothetical protein